MRTVLMAAAVLAGGCAAQMKGLDEKWSGKEAPVCDSSLGYFAGDLVWATSAGTIAIATARTEDTKTLAIVSGLLAAGFGIGSIISASTATECSHAKQKWVASQTKQPAPQQPVVVNVQAPAAPVVTPRGFFCSISPTVDTANMCAREKPLCEQARGMVVGTVPDLTPCTLVEQAWCVGDRCFATEAACNAQRGDAACEVR